MEVGAGLEAATGLEQRQQDLPRRPRVGRRLEHHDVARAKAGRDLGGGVLDDGEVRLAVRRERGRECDQDRVDILQDVVVTRRRDEAGVDEGLEGLGGHVTDVTLAPVDAVDHLLVHVDEHHALAGIGKDPREGHTDVSGTHDGNVCSHDQTRLLRRHPGYTTHPFLGR